MSNSSNNSSDSDNIIQLDTNDSLNTNANTKKQTDEYETEYKDDNIEISKMEGLEYLKSIDKNVIDLILTDPPYITSRKTGMNEQAKIVKKFEDTKKNTKTEEQWKEYKTKEQWNQFFIEKKIPKENQKKKLEEYKQNYLAYGSILGKKYGVTTDYGDWDRDFTTETLTKFVREFYRVLKKGGTAIIFFDLWKITTLKDIMEKAGFKQLRFIEWIKTNPQPLNSSLNYLTNCREIALLGVKGGKPTFNSKYDKGIYEYPIATDKNKFHPTQKNLKLFEALVKKHSNKNDIVLDPFLGSGTTAKACQNTNRKFKGCEVAKEYYNKFIPLIVKNKQVNDEKNNDD